VHGFPDAMNETHIEALFAMFCEVIMSISHVSYGCPYMQRSVGNLSIITCVYCLSFHRSNDFLVRFKIIAGDE